MHVWSGECHVHADIQAVGHRRRARGAPIDSFIHPECGCVTSVMEYVAAGDVDAEGVHMLLDRRHARLRQEAERASVRAGP